MGIFSSREDNHENDVIDKEKHKELLKKITETMNVKQSATFNGDITMILTDKNMLYVFGSSKYYIKSPSGSIICAREEIPTFICENTTYLGLSGNGFGICIDTDNGNERYHFNIDRTGMTGFL